ncbi:GGDEF domain-containing protein [Mycobacterium manitobense]|uniref:GGDEF domain-containing protein n=1 Tax=[Mycobacterium] manitobense TaxID=190147 RepID=A0A9X2YRE7_9MYCO|nr:GGDEF domain-containing protein [[Mycobacterium] manitobense]MCV7172783.1 GGDEF domain-containing protein [[Mycobacterium] manitobense]
MTASRRVVPADHYYWLTAILAARGAQVRTCRVIAGSVIVAGALPLILTTSSIGPQTARDRTIAAAVAVICLVVGLLWLRRRWPSRSQSATSVVIGTVAVTAGCLIQPVPLLGLLGATCFAIITAYVAFFHSLRLLAVVWVGVAATLLTLGLRMTGDATLAVVGAVLVTTVNVVVIYTCRTASRLIVTDIDQAEIEPLTGLLNREAFGLRAATLLASRSRDDDRYFVMVVVSIDSFSLRVDVGGEHVGNQVRVAVGQTMRENVRQNAVIAHVLTGEADAEFLIADTFTTADASPLVERLRGAVATTPSGLTASIGVVSTPLRPLTLHPPDEVLDEVIGIATAAMLEARVAGGNQARYVRNPPLRVLGGPTAFD